MRKKSTALAFFLGLALLTTGCSSSSSAGDAAEPAADATAEEEVVVRADADLVIWTDELKQPAVQTAADKFAADNGVTVAVQVVANDLQAAVVTANAAGNGPDVFTGAHDWIGNLVRNGTIEPLQLTAADLAGYTDISVKATTYDGKQYALPYGQEAIALYRNTDLAPDAPATLDEAFEVGKQAVADGKAESAFNLQQGENGDAYHMAPVFTSMGGYLFGATAAGDPDPSDVGVGKDGSLAAAKKIAELGDTGEKILSTSISGDNSIALFAEGKAAFLVSGPWALNDINAGGINYAISPIPGFAGEKPAQPFAGVQGFYVAAGGANKLLGQEFVSKALNTEEAMTAMYEGAKLPPAMKSVQATAIAADANVETFLAAADGGLPMPAIPAMAAVWEPLGKAYSAIIGGADPVTTMTDAGQTIVDAIAAS